MMEKKKDIAVLVGSLRQASVNRKTAYALAELAPDALDLGIVEIGDMPLYNQEFDEDPERLPRSYAAFRHRIAEADGVLFVTPEYNRSVPAVLKNAIDVGSRPYGKSAWAGKPAGIMSVAHGAIGGFGANHHLRQSLVFLDMPTLQQPEAYIGGGDKLFDEAGRLTAESTRGFLRGYMEKFAAWVERHAGARVNS